MPSDRDDTGSPRNPAQEVMMSAGEWQGLIDLLRAAADSDPDAAVSDDIDGSAAYFMENYAEYIEDSRRDWS